MRKHEEGYELIREVRFRPYTKGKGPKFTLYLYDTNRSAFGKNVVAYRFQEGQEVIFEGDGFTCSPLYAIDSDEYVNAIMGFITLRPGDTDKEYFDDYTGRQLRFADEHAEALGMECIYRYEKENK